MDVLFWIVCPKGPLTTLELLHAIALETDRSKLDKDNLSDIDYMMSLRVWLQLTSKVILSD
jgi:hypothetical protein